MNGKGIFFALLTALCWSTSGLFVKQIGQSAYVIAGMQSMIALLLNILYTRKRIHFSFFIVVVGFIQFMMHITFMMANQLTTIGNAIVLQYSSMIFVLLYQSIDQKKKPEKYQWIVIGLAVLGMVLFFMDDFSFDSIKGNGLAIVSGAFFGLQFYLNSKKQADASSSMKIQYLFSILFFLLYVLKNPVLSFSKQDGFYIALLGIITAGLAGVFFTKCIERIPPFSANVLCMSEIVFAPVLAFLILHEWFTFHSLLGAIFIVLSLMYNVYEQKKGDSYV